MTPVAAESDAMVQLEKYKGNTAKQGLPFHYTVWPVKAASQSLSMGLPHRNHTGNSLAWFYFVFCCLFFFSLQGSDLSWLIPQEAMSHHWIAVLVWKVKTVRWSPTAPLSEETNSSGAWGGGANRQVLPTGWVSGFWRLQPPPKSWSSSQTVGRIPISGRNVGSRATGWEWEAWRQAVPCQRPGETGGAKLDSTVRFTPASPLLHATERGRWASLY